MRRVLFILASLSLVSGVSLAEDTAAAAKPAEALVCDAESDAAEQIADPQKKLEDTMTFQPAPTATAAPPPCPTTSTCVGGSNSCSTNPANCAATGRTSVFDTGLTSCTLPNGVVGVCIFGTIKIYTTQCRQCKCCSQTPACLCPLNCGQAQSWDCA